MKKNTLKKAIAILSTAALLCSSAAAYAAQVDSPSEIETAAVQSAQAPVKIDLRGYRLSDAHLYMNIGVSENVPNIAKLEHRVTIQKQSRDPSTEPSGWWNYMEDRYPSVTNGDFFIWASSIQYDPSVEGIRAVVEMRVTYDSGATEMVYQTFTF